MTHLLVTNDFPPKDGGIQVYLWELWRRLSPDSFAVLTASSHPDAARFDEEQRRNGYRIERIDSAVLLPTPGLVRSTRRLASEIGADLVVIDPALPSGLVGPRLGIPYGIVVHGAELAAPARLPVSTQLTREVLSGAELVICAGSYPAAEVRRILGRGSDAQGKGLEHDRPAIVEIPPGVDVERFRPLEEEKREEVREDLGLAPTAPLVVSVSRLVPRKGMDVLIEAGAGLLDSYPELQILIGGAGRDIKRLERLASSTGAPVRFLGRVADEDLPNLYAAADVFVMACRERWLGLEQEGFGIVFLEAAACGVPQVAGASGGAAEAVEDGRTGIVVSDPDDPGEVAVALRRILSDQRLRRSMGEAARRRAVEFFDYGALSLRLGEALGQMEG